MENNEAYGKALERINACIAEIAITLDLSNLGLEVIPKEVGKCYWITEFDLSFNQITEIKGLEQLVELQRLNLSRNQITEIKGLEQLVGLQSLNLSNNQINEIKGLEQVVGLKAISLSDNKITEIKGLEQLVELQELYLSNNQITEIKGLEQLGGLQSLLLSNNQITEIKGLEQLVGLQELRLSYNQITEIKRLEQLVGLQTLILSNNQISEIKGLEQLPSLKEVLLSDNWITKLEALLPLINLEYSDVYFSIGNNAVLQQLPSDLVEAGWAAIRDWLIATNNKEVFEPINEIKLLLLGNTNVGKSNLLNYFETNSLMYEEDTTHGIRYSALTNLIKDINVNCWDFGGQEFYHATHQLFFSPGGLHIVLWSKKDVQRFTNKPELCFDLSYWLRCIEQLISHQKDDNKDETNKRKKIEVLVCENKIDMSGYKTAHLNQPAIQEKFAELELTFTGINLVPLKYFESLKELIAEKARGLVLKRPPFYKKYLEKIRQRKSPFVLLKDIYNNDVDGSRKRVENTMEVFNNMGLLLYFPSIIPDKVFTQPQVLLDLLYEKVLHNKGNESITRQKINEAIDNNKLELQNQQVIELLLHFDLVFQIPDEPEVYFIPQYLSAPSSFIDFFHRHQFNQANIRIASDNFLMNVAMLKVFGKYGSYVKKDNKQDHLFWKDGIVIEKDNMLLMVKFDRVKQYIELYPDNHHNNFTLQKEVVRFILDIPNQKHIEQRRKELAKKFDVTPSEVKVKTKDKLIERGIMGSWYSGYFDVLISLDGKFFVPWTTIVKQVEQGIFQVQTVQELMIENNKEVIRKVKTISVFDYNKYLPEKDKGQMKKVFISYSKEDLRMVNKFIEHLSALQLDGKIAHWYCTELTAGGDWNHEIQEHFDAADIACFMISPNFMKTKYIHEHEIKKAFERKDKGKKLTIVPIILDFCKWTTKVNNLGDFTALPYMVKPVADFQNENMAWYIIQECLRLMIENDLNPNGEDFYRSQPLPKDVIKIFERIAEGRVDNNTSN